MSKRQQITTTTHQDKLELMDRDVGRAMSVWRDCRRALSTLTEPHTDGESSSSLIFEANANVRSSRETLRHFMSVRDQHLEDGKELDLQDLIQRVVDKAAREIRNLPTNIDTLCTMLASSADTGIYTLGDVFRKERLVRNIISRHGVFTEGALIGALYNPYLELLEYPVSLFLSRRVLSSASIATFTGRYDDEDVKLKDWITHRQDTTSTIKSEDTIDGIVFMLDGLASHLLKVEASSVKDALMQLTAMRPMPMTAPLTDLLGLKLLGPTRAIAEALCSTQNGDRDDGKVMGGSHPIRCVVSTPRSGKTRTLDEVATMMSAANPPVMIGSTTPTLIVNKLVVNMTYTSQSPLEVCEAVPGIFYRRFWGRFLRGCSHPLLVNQFQELMEPGCSYSTVCTREDVWAIIGQLYGITSLDKIVVNVDEFSHVLDLHNNASKDGTNVDTGTIMKEQYRSITSWLAGGAQFVFSGFHYSAMSAFSTMCGVPLETYALPTISPINMQTMLTPTCILHAVGKRRGSGRMFPLAVYEAAKSSVGLMGWAVENCVGIINQSAFFDTPWQQTLQRDATTLQPLLLKYLKQTMCTTPRMPRGGEKEGLCMYLSDLDDNTSHLTIHPYALFTLLELGNQTGADDDQFTTQVFAMWAAYSKAISEFELALETGDDESIDNARGHSITVLLSHVQSLRHRHGGGLVSPPVEVSHHNNYRQEEVELILTRPLMLLLPGPS